MKSVSAPRLYGFMLLAAALASGCVSKPPTIAHVHLGHAITGVHVTPNQEGYMLLAEEQAQQANDLAELAGQAETLETIQAAIARVVEVTTSPEQFGLQQSLMLAANHISFAAMSEDASLNIQKFAPAFANEIARVVERCELIGLLGQDVQATASLDEALTLAAEIRELAAENVRGEDADGDGVVGGEPAEFGMAQLRKQLETMIDREDPPYRTVDQWYLFNLVRLPNGRWVFDKLGRGGNVEGYK